MDKIYLKDLNTLRDRYLLTVEEFCSRTKINLNTYFRMQRGTNPRLSTIKNIANYFNLIIGKDDHGIYFTIPEPHLISSKNTFAVNENGKNYSPQAITDKDIELLHFIRDELGIADREDGERKLAVFLDEKGRLDQAIIQAIKLIIEKGKMK